MKLIVAIVQADDAGDLTRGLTQKGYRSTRINTAGGFLREGNATILIGTEARQVDDVMETISRHCHSRKRHLATPPPMVGASEFSFPLPVEVSVGGATVFVLDVERFERL